MQTDALTTAALPAPALALNTSFSTSLPTLQLAVDSTSLGEFKICPRRYQLAIIEGWQPKGKSVHLEFGIAFHKAREEYEHLRAAGTEHDPALCECVRSALRATWDSELQRGVQWDHPQKNRKTLIQSIVAYLDEIAQNDPLETVKLTSGHPAVELSFTVPLPLASESTGEPYSLCGHLDRVVALGDKFYISDIKTTTGELGPGFFSKFTPDNQMSLYTLAGKVAFGLEISGVLIDGVQVLAGGTRFQRGMVPRQPAVLEEWYEGLGLWLRQMESCAETGHWPMNDKSCHTAYGGCQFREVCSRCGSARQQWLEGNFARRVWDPLKRRGPGVEG
jgi:hypothetical protein